MNYLSKIVSVQNRDSLELPPTAVFFRFVSKTACKQNIRLSDLSIECVLFTKMTYRKNI